MDEVVSPVDHRLPPVSEEVSTTESPSQKVVAPDAEITGAEGIGFTVIATGEEESEAQPFPSVYSNV